MTPGMFVAIGVALTGCTVAPGTCPELNPTPSLRARGVHLEPGECVHVVKSAFDFDAGTAYGTRQIICGCQGDAGYFDTRDMNVDESRPATNKGRSPSQ